LILSALTFTKQHTVLISLAE